MTQRRPAGRPAARTVDVEITGGDFAGWSITIRADFPARILAELQSGNLERIGAALDRIVVSHNLPDLDGKIAASMLDVDPYAGMLKLAGDALTKIGQLPNR